MSIPGQNILNMAFSLIAKSSFQYYAYTSRGLQPNGLYLTTYGEPVTLMGSLQPVPRYKYEVYGLDFQKNYINVYLPKNALDIARDVSGDQIVFNGNYYQVVSKTDWFAVDGWDAILCVQVLNPAS